jgi:predicted HTH domain antitoxin
MSLTIEISKEVEDALRQEWGDLTKAATESLLIESYRTGRISLGFLAKILGIGRWDAEKWLGDRGVTWNYGLDDLEGDRVTMGRIFGCQS